MRAPLLLTALLALSACGSKVPTEQAQDLNQSLTADNIVSNDITAIDAVTGDAANMAADVDMNFGGLDENVVDAATDAPAASVKSKPKKGAPIKKPGTANKRPAAAPTPANTIANASTNGN